jgi:hypothetical protein
MKYLIILSLLLQACGGSSGGSAGGSLTSSDVPSNGVTLNTYTITITGDNVTYVTALYTDTMQAASGPFSVTPSQTMTHVATGNNVTSLVIQRTNTNGTRAFVTAYKNGQSLGTFPLDSSGDYQNFGTP